AIPDRLHEAQPIAQVELQDIRQREMLHVHRIAHLRSSCSLGSQFPIAEPAEERRLSGRSTSTCASRGLSSHTRKERLRGTETPVTATKSNSVPSNPDMSIDDSVSEAQVAGWVQAAAAGDRGAARDVLRAVQDRVYRLALRMLGHPQDAEDAA